MQLLYIQQLLVLPGQAGHSRSWEMAMYWQAAGHEVSILTSTAHLEQHPDFPSDPDFPLIWVYQGIQLIVLDVAYAHTMSFRHRIQAFVAFYRQAKRLMIKQPAFDAVLAYTAPLSVAELGKAISQAWKVPFFLEVADVWPDVPIGMNILRNPGLIWWLRRRTRSIYRHARRIFPFSPDMVRQIEAHGVPSHKLSLALPGAALKPYTMPAIPPKPTSRSVRVLYTGTIGQANDLSMVLKAFSYAQAFSSTPMRFDLVGHGNDFERIKAYADKLHTQEIYFHGQMPREALKSYLQQADIAVVSFASFPVLEANAAAKLFDYLAAGLPVLINYRGWQASLLHAHACGMSCDQGDWKMWARNLLWLAQQKKVRYAMSRHARALARAQFDRGQIATRMMDQMLDDINA